MDSCYASGTNLPPGTPHLAILEPYCNHHITFEDGNTSDPESDTKDCGFQESIISDVENSDASGILVNRADTSHSWTFVKTDSLPLTTTLDEEKIKEIENNIKKEGTVCEEEELEKCEMIKEEVFSYPEFNDPLSSGVTYIKLKIKKEPIEDQENEKQMEIEEDENEINLKEMGHEVSLREDKGKELEKCIKDEVEVSFEENRPILIDEPVTSDSAMTLTLFCLSVRIGTFKIYPTSPDNMLKVSLSTDGLSFYSPVVTDGSMRIKVTIRPHDVTRIRGYFGKWIPMLFISTTSLFAEAVYKSLNMGKSGSGIYDPFSNNPKMNKITFLLVDNSLTNERCKFLRQTFSLLEELDKQKANQLLVMSTPCR